VIEQVCNMKQKFITNWRKFIELNPERQKGGNNNNENTVGWGLRRKIVEGENKKSDRQKLWCQVEKI